MWVNGGATGVTEARTTLCNNAIAAITGVTHIDMFTLLGGFDNDKTDDGIHPNPLAQSMYGKAIARTILSL